MNTQPQDFVAYSIEVTEQIAAAYSAAASESIYPERMAACLAAMRPKGADAADTAIAGFEAGVPAVVAAACYVSWQHQEYVKQSSVLKQLVSRHARAMTDVRMLAVRSASQLLGNYGSAAHAFWQAMERYRLGDTPRLLSLADEVAPMLAATDPPADPGPKETPYLMLVEPTADELRIQAELERLSDRYGAGEFDDAEYDSAIAAVIDRELGAGASQNDAFTLLWARYEAGDLADEDYRARIGDEIRMAKNIATAW
ncbi:MAG TPA: hypothetical protein VFG73_02450 [Rhodanobacteraceae bacterium]|nr:hypothetical protein [Rhodanobacteraceae bacterium]